VTLPYTVETNDITMMIVQHHEAQHWTQKCIDTFDRLYEESARRPKIHGHRHPPLYQRQPFRIKYLEAVYAHIAQFSGVLHWNGEQILNWYVTRDKRGEQ